MTHRFDDAALAGVLRHMNTDHEDDNLLIGRAFCPEPDVTGSTMTDFDGDGGTWRVRLGSGEEMDIGVPWPNGPILERPEVRREIVALYDQACRILGQEPRPHA